MLLRHRRLFGAPVRQEVVTAEAIDFIKYSFDVRAVGFDGLQKHCTADSAHTHFRTWQTKCLGQADGLAPAVLEQLGESGLRQRGRSLLVK